MSGEMDQVVFICHPFAGRGPLDPVRLEENARRMTSIMEGAIREMGVCPVAPPILYDCVLREDRPGDREVGLRICRLLLGRCDEIWIFDGPRGELSPGMEMEIAEARKRGLVRRWESRGELHEVHEALAGTGDG